MLDISSIGLVSQPKESESDVLSAGNFLEAGTSDAPAPLSPTVAPEGPLPLCTGAEASHYRVGILTSAKPNKLRDYGKHKN